jgi:hypothetical protein
MSFGTIYMITERCTIYQINITIYQNYQTDKTIYFRPGYHFSEPYHHLSKLHHHLSKWHHHLSKRHRHIETTNYNHITIYENDITIYQNHKAPGIYEIEKNRILKESPTRRNWKCCRLVWLSLIMDGTGKCKLPSTPPSSDLSRIQQLNTKMMVNFELRNIRKCIRTVVIMERSIWHSSAVRWKAVQGPKCRKRENNGRN